MAWNTSVVAYLDLSGGYHLNIGPEQLTDAAKPYQTFPRSPSCVWAGDPGVPQDIQTVAADGTVTTSPNPDWTADSPAYTTVFLLFPDEATAQACLPALWTPDVSIGP